MRQIDHFQKFLQGIPAFLCITPICGCFYWFTHYVLCIAVTRCTWGVRTPAKVTNNGHRFDEGYMGGRMALVTPKVTTPP